ncbi:MAG: peptidase S14 [Ancylobacter novellus]|uniref:ATP-dependent Clp protease proteolytic subunit n=1 Tax=Ancylobacter novellus TaxID=921 RepID=A0A2W5K9A7_ANCNO|nr:MAG: peptidase S14 [Ancylobacter novellus]
MTVRVSGSEITLSGTVGALWYDEGFTASEVIAALAQVGDENDVTIRLNSGGGIATEGSAIHAAIARHTGKTTIVVEGIAASAASLLAMAGDEIEMALGSTMMIHDPSGFTYGTAAEHEMSLRALNALATSFSNVYAAKSGRTAQQCRADMKAETWLTPDDAVTQGYATRAGSKPANDNDAEPAVAAFDYRIYAHAPKRLTALAEKNDWRMSVTRPPAASAAPTPEKEPPMPEPKAGATTPEDIAAARQAASTLAIEISDICAKAGVPAMTTQLLREGVTAEQARARTSQAKDIRMAVDLARQKDPTIEANAADVYLAEGKSLDQVRAALFERFVAKEEKTPINPTTPLATPEAGASSATASMQRQLKRAGVKQEA